MREVARALARAAWGGRKRQAAPALLFVFAAFADCIADKCRFFQPPGPLRETPASETLNRPLRGDGSLIIAAKRAIVGECTD